MLRYISRYKDRLATLRLLAPASPGGSELSHDGSDQARLCEYFVVCGLHPDDPPEIMTFPALSEDVEPASGGLGTLADGRWRPKQTQRIPTEDHVDCSFPSMLDGFCFPDGISLSAVQRPATFSFSCLTTEDGGRLYCIALYFDEELSEIFSRLITGLHYAAQQKAAGARQSNRSARMQTPGSVPRLYARKCIAVLSRYPFYSFLGHFLFQIAKLLALPCALATSTESLAALSPPPAGASADGNPFLVAPIEEFINRFIYDTPVPKPGLAVRIHLSDALHFSCPPPTELPSLDFSLRPFFRLFDLDNMLLLISCLLQEQRIIAYSSEPGLLYLCLEAALGLIFPFKYPHPYAPVLPSSLAAPFLEAPFPFVIGISSRILPPDIQPRDFVGDEINLVDIDNGRVDLAPATLALGARLHLPPKQRRKLRAVLEQNSLHRSGQAHQAPASSPAPPQTPAPAPPTGAAAVAASPAAGTASPAPLDPTASGTGSNGTPGPAGGSGSFRGGGSPAPPAATARTTTTTTTHSLLELTSVSSVLDPRDSHIRTRLESRAGDVWQQQMLLSTHSPSSSMRRKGSIRQRPSVSRRLKPDRTVKALETYSPDEIFSAEDCRNAFLRFFVSLFLRYSQYLAPPCPEGAEMPPDRPFRNEDYMEDYPDAKPFLSIFLQTQMWNCFCLDRIMTPETSTPAEIAFFEDAIVAKLQRYKLKRLHTYKRPDEDKTKVPSTPPAAQPDVSISRPLNAPVDPNEPPTHMLAEKDQRCEVIPPPADDGRARGAFSRFPVLQPPPLYIPFRELPRYTAAAMVIQTRYRVHLARVQFLRARRRIIVIQALYRMRAPRRAYLKQLAGFTRIQAITRARRARREFLADRANVVKVQAVWRARAQQAAYKRILAVMVALQAAVRMHRARRAYRADRAAVIAAQALVRARQQRIAYQRDLAAVRLCQAVARGRVARTEYARLRAQHLAARAIQRWYRQIVYERRVREHADSASLLIQRQFRRHRAQRDYHRARARIVIVQSLVRSRLEAGRIKATIKKAADKVLAELFTVWQQLHVSLVVRSHFVVAFVVSAGKSVQSQMTALRAYRQELSKLRATAMTSKAEKAAAKLVDRERTQLVDALKKPSPALLKRATDRPWALDPKDKKARKRLAKMVWSEYVHMIESAELILAARL